MAEPVTALEASAAEATLEVPDAVNPAAAAEQASGGRCTQAQLRRFIKSRPYVPLHELRRRFELNGHPDDVTPVRLPDGLIWVGLPPREAGFLGELVRAGDVGLELCHDPVVRMVVGVYAMRPISR